MRFTVARLIFGVAFLALALAPASAQVSRTRAALETQTQACVVDNTTGSVTPACLRNALLNIVASEATLSDSTNPLNLSGATLAPGSTILSPSTSGGVLSDSAGTLTDSTTLPSGLSVPGANLGTPAAINLANASNLPPPSASTLGGVESITSLSHNWIDYIGTSGVPHQSQPTISDVSGLGSGVATAAGAALDGASGLSSVAGLATTIAGGTLPGSFTTLAASTSLSFARLADSATPPTISSGCGAGSPSISAGNGTDAFVVTIGTASGSTCVIAMPTATTGWVCSANDITTHTTANFQVLQTASSASSVTVTDYSDIAGAATWVSADKIGFLCRAY
ncbi:MAG: hypothetical protein P4L76_18105 [Beijerinckiaceae bacterium]|nr:hypothetical protein [Beijerinckiaceae bacterium]